MMKKKLALFMTMAMILTAIMPTTSYAQTNISQTRAAKAVSPVNFEVTTNTVKSGERNVPVSDIVITEAEPGIFKKDMSIYLQLEHIPFEDGLGAMCKVEAGDLQIKKLDVDNDVLKITIKRASSFTPATIRIKNLALFLDEALPEGDYDLRLITEESSRFKNNMFAQNYGDDDELGKFDVPYVTLLEDYVHVVTPEGHEVPSTNKTETVQNSSFEEPMPKISIEQGSNIMIVGSQEKELSGPAYVQEGRIMLPVRDITEALSSSAVVKWDGASNSVVVMYGSRIATFKVGEKILNVNGVEIPMEAPAEITYGRVYLPIRELGYILGLNDSKIHWDSETNTATLN